MVDGRIDGAQPMVRTSGTTGGDSKSKVIAKLKPGESLFTQKGEVEYMNNRLSGGTVKSIRTDLTFKDFNGDGVITSDELYLIDRHTQKTDGTTTVTRYKDKDGDGYSDSVTTYKYDKNGKKVREETKYEEDINSVKKRDHLEYEEHNRKMSTHQDGIYMM